MRLTQVLYLLLALAASLAATSEIGGGHSKQPSRYGSGSSNGRQKEALQLNGRSKNKHSSAIKGNDKETRSGDKRRKPERLNFTEANKQIDRVIKTKYKKAKAALKKQRKPTKDQVKQKACHSLAILRCGCTALGNYEAEQNRSKAVPLETKCTIRKNFFRCLDESETATHCRHWNSKVLKPKSSYRHHMKEIVRVLWSTRGCLLGVDDTPRTSRVNSAFCAKVNGVGGGGTGGASGGGKTNKGKKAKVAGTAS